MPQLVPLHDVLQMVGLRRNCFQIILNRMAQFRTEKTEECFFEGLHGIY